MGQNFTRKHSRGVHDGKDVLLHAVHLLIGAEIAIAEVVALLHQDVEENQFGVGRVKVLGVDLVGDDADGLSVA